MPTGKETRMTERPVRVAEELPLQGEESVGDFTSALNKALYQKFNDDMYAEEVFDGRVIIYFYGDDSNAGKYFEVEYTRESDGKFVISDLGQEVQRKTIFTPVEQFEYLRKALTSHPRHMTPTERKTYRETVEETANAVLMTRRAVHPRDHRNLKGEELLRELWTEFELRREDDISDEVNQLVNTALDFLEVAKN